MTDSTKGNEDSKELKIMKIRIQKFLKEIENEIAENFGNSSIGTEYVKIRLNTILNGDSKNE